PLNQLMSFKIHIDLHRELFPPTKLDYFEQGKYSDFIIEVDNVILNVHKRVLSEKSSYFCRLFSNQFKETRDNKLILLEDNPETIKVMIKYIYGATQVNFNCLDLLRVANKYQVNDLVHSCDNAICGCITSENVSDILDLARAINNNVLLDACKSYMG